MVRSFVLSGAFAALAARKKRMSPNEYADYKPAC